MSHWLMKTEPDVFGIHHLEKKGVEHWDGVRNYQARNHMRAMKQGDQVLFYHSSVQPPGIAGLARVKEAAYPDFTSWDPRSKYFDEKSTPDNPRWSMVDVEYVETFATFVTLADLRETPGLEDMLVLRRGMRLSVQPVAPAEYRIICKLGRRRRQS